VGKNAQVRDPVISVADVLQQRLTICEVQIGMEIGRPRPI